jgi:hypothetical protein
MKFDFPSAFAPTEDPGPQFDVNLRKIAPVLYLYAGEAELSAFCPAHLQATPLLLTALAGCSVCVFPAIRARFAADLPCSRAAERVFNVAQTEEKVNRESPPGLRGSCVKRGFWYILHGKKCVLEMPWCQEQGYGPAFGGIRRIG